MKCKHENATGYMWRDTPKHLSAIGIVGQWGYAFTQPGKVGHHHKIVCDDCGAWLSLGPANDKGVEHEIRAAEIAQGLALRFPSTRIEHPAMNLAARYAAQCGYDDKQPAFAWSCGWTGLENAYEAGYLARCITQHPEGES